MSAHPMRQTLADLVESRAGAHPDAPAVGDGSTVLSYAELAGRARAVAALLQARGVRPGDHVLLAGHNCTTWVVAAFGIALAGATIVPIGFGMSAGERERVVHGLEPRLLLVEDGLWPDTGPARTVVPFSELAALAPQPRRHPGVLVDSDAEALVLCTSGTTGAVKHVPMTHHQLLRVYSDTATRLGFGESDRFLCVVPLAHSFGFNGILLAGLLAGGYVRLVPSYDAASLPAVVRSDRLTVVAGPPTVHHDLAAAGPAATGDTPRLAVTGSTEVSAPAMWELVRSLGIAELAVGYGMTETCGTVAVGLVDPDDPAPVPMLPPLPGVELRICDDEGLDLPAGAHGRILVRGYNVCRPYAHAPDLAVGGWFDTGDMGVLDERGRLCVAGRRTDTIIVSGFNVYPREVEQVLCAHPGVAAAAVVGLGHPRQGQRLVACIVPDGTAPAPADLVAHGREHLAAYKVPREYVFLDELPATGTGKVSRAALRDIVTRRMQGAW
ncbi:class I adenylate-forming enzyme family protein [Blastococcus sp. SYSU D00820]